MNIDFNYFKNMFAQPFSSFLMFIVSGYLGVQYLKEKLQNDHKSILLN